MDTTGSARVADPARPADPPVDPAARADPPADPAAPVGARTGPRPVRLDAGVTTRCRRRVHLEHDPRHVDPSLPGRAALPVEPDPGVEMRRRDAVEHRAQLARRWAAALEPVAVPAGTDGAERTRRLRAALVAGAPAVAALELPPGHGRRGAAELLVPSRDGWAPVVVVRHRVTDPGSGARTSPVDAPFPASARRDDTRRPRTASRDVLRLAHLHRMLAAEGLAPTTAGPVWGGVVGLDADVVVWHDLAAPTGTGGGSVLASYDRRFGDRVAVAEAARDGRSPLAEPSRITECRQCPWWPTCEATLRERDDVSLVVRGEAALRLRGHGVTTVRTLAALDPARGPADPAATDAADPVAGVDLREAVALARAWRADIPLVRRVERPDVPRGDVEIDVDMESLGEDGAYLWGTLLCGADVGLAPGYRAFATWEPLPTPDEGRSFAAFWTWLRDVRARAAHRGLTVRAYCYNEQAENRWLRASATRFAGAPGVPEPAEVEAFIASAEWVDLFPAVGAAFLCPHGKGLKRVAPAAGFGWRDPEAGGENSMRWYRRAVGLDGDEPDRSQRERLLAYNEDDVRATATLRAWMTSDAVLAVPLLDALPADPAVPVGGPVSPRSA